MLSFDFFVAQLLNGVQFGIMLFLIAAGLTLVLGIMNLINLAHGSLYMIGAYLGATFIVQTGSFLIGTVAAIVGTGESAMLVIERCNRSTSVKIFRRVSICVPSGERVADMSKRSSPTVNAGPSAASTMARIVSSW